MSRAPLKILHVEDDVLYADLMQALLKEEPGLNKYEIVHVDSLKKALGELKEKGFGAVLLDLTLNDVSGLDNVRAISEANPDLPIIVLSGADNEDMAMQALEQGAQDYIVKGYANRKVVQLAINSSIKRKAVERDLYHRANYDDLTGLANRKHFMSYLQRDLNAAKRWQRNETLLFIDVDHFKQINDTFGHEAGNAVLKEVANRLTSTLRTTDLVARYGGDEFVVLLDHGADPNCDPKFASASIVTKLQNAFNNAVEWQGKRIEFTVSIGIAIYPDAGESVEAMIENADKAMYEAKKQGGRHFRFAFFGQDTRH